MEKKETSANYPVIKFGNAQVKLLRRGWKSGKKIPYRMTYALKPGQHWSEAEENSKLSEGYVQTSEGNQIPVGARVARELINKGADKAVFTELSGPYKCTLVNQCLFCVCISTKRKTDVGKYEEYKDFVQILDDIRSNNNGSLGGLPDVMAVFPDGRIAFREAKRSGKDRLQPNQHKMANLLRELFGERLDLGVVEWDA